MTPIEKAILAVGSQAKLAKALGKILNLFIE
ncbi:helix-turn-helix domain-containing protein [Avibacterium paragallinarum]|uniref:Uncharacterized protein n=1 Tax=Avibacterium paragallinarum TaxID=728 RepID=A0A380Z432_AVIPA|nr:helix-turn-helix domain-containing protein [Avibacterium paragallinarum]SUV40789.1 Uncharacterised protein [Avibacterium paragallinarum]